MLHVLSADYKGAYRIHLRFSDGREGTIDLQSRLHGEVFEPLRDPKFFAAFKLNSDFGVIEWDNGADLAPEALATYLQ